MRIIGLTGNIGAGKSEVARLLIQRGHPVIDADALGHELLACDPETRRLVDEAFPGVVLPGGGLDRRRLAAEVFSSPPARARLESILHPRIWRAFDQWVARLPPGVDLIFFEAALLQEIHRERFEGLIVVTAPEELRLQRAMQRDGVSAEEIRARMQAQRSDAEQLAAADWVIDNGGDRAATENQVDDCLQRLKTGMLR